MKPCIRPTLHVLDTDEADEENNNNEMMNLIGRCWTEEPMERPDFNVIKGVVKRLNK